MGRLISNIIKTFGIVSIATLIKISLVHGVMSMTELTMVPAIPIALLIMSVIVGGAITYKKWP